jgi:hypothetical protein
MNLKRLVESMFIANLLILALSCGQRSTEWKGTINEADGVMVVKNPLEPIFGDDAIGLIEDLTIGEAEGSEEYMFSNITSVAVDGLDNIYVLDSKEAHIKVFDRFGKYMHTYGGKGQAPDEFQGPRDLTITPQNEILVNDSGARLLKFFDLDGAPLRQISHARYWSFSKPQVDISGDILGGYGIIGDKGIITQHVVKFTAEFDESFTVSTVELARNPDFNPYFARQYWALTREGNIVWGFPIEYNIHVMDARGRLLQTIQKEYLPVPITEEEKEQWIEDFYGGAQNIPSDVNVVWDEYRNAYQHISLDGQDRIYVQTYELDDATGNSIYDVFDSDGRCLARVVLISPPMAWKGNRLFTREDDEDGYQYVKRYKVSWKY